MLYQYYSKYNVMYQSNQNKKKRRIIKTESFTYFMQLRCNNINENKTEISILNMIYYLFTYTRI